MSAQDSLNTQVTGIAAESGRALGSGMKSNGGSDEGSITELYKINQVWYRLPPTLSLVSKRTLLVNQSQRVSYPNPYNDVITFIFNTGEFYTSMSTSYLYMEIGYNSPAASDNVPTITGGGAAIPANSYAWAKALMSQGNAMSLFEEIVFLSASGTEICREQNKGLESSVRFRYEHEQQYIDTIGQVQGAAYGPYMKNYDGVGPQFDMSIGGNSGLNSSNLNPIGGWNTLVQPRSGNGSIAYMDQGLRNLNNTNIIQGNAYQSFCIPMDQVLGCFKPYMSTLFPAGALAGGRLEMRLKNPLESLQFIAGAIETNAGTPDVTNPYLANLITANQSGLTINKIYMVMDCFQMQDNVLKRLNQISAGPDGLSVLFDTYDHTSILAQGTGTVEAQVAQARSRIVRSYCVVRDTQNIVNPYVNSLASEAVVQRVSAVDQGGYANIGVSEPLTGYNKIGINGSFTLLTLPDSTGDTKGDPAYNPLTTNISYPWIVKPRLPNNPYSGINLNVTSYQAQLGALFFPQQPLTTVAEYYQNAMYIWCKGIPDKCDLSSVAYQDFIGGTGWFLYDPTIPTNTTNISWPPTGGQVANNPTGNAMFGQWVAPWGLAIFGMLAEKSQALQLSGLPISNARLMRHKLTFQYPPLSQQSRTISVFTQYTRVMKVFLGGRIVVRE